MRQSSRGQARTSGRRTGWELSAAARAPVAGMARDAARSDLKTPEVASCAGAFRELSLPDPGLLALADPGLLGFRFCADDMSADARWAA